MQTDKELKNERDYAYECLGLFAAAMPDEWIKDTISAYHRAMVLRRELPTLILREKTMRKENEYLKEQLKKFMFPDFNDASSSPSATEPAK